MDLREQLEYPAPKICKDNGKIYIETSKSCEGHIVIKNDGGGVIKGRIMSNSRALTFDPEYFTGNDFKVVFHINLDIYKTGDTFHTDAVIVSNGGEHTIEFIVKVIPYAIETEQGINIASINDFFAYGLKYPVFARQIFVSHEFMMWLYSSGYQYMDIYEFFVKDANKERALDNFFISNGLKEPGKISVQDQNINIKFRPTDHELYRGFININLDHWGYIDQEISTMLKSPWLKIEKDRILSADFAPKDYFNLPYAIDPQKLEHQMNMDKILIGNNVITVTAVKRSFISVMLENEYLDLQEKSSVVIHNYTGSKLTVDILTEDSFIKFEGFRFVVGDYAKIPFMVKLSTVQKTQLSLKKQAVLNGRIQIQSVFNGQQYNKVFHLAAGNFK